MGTSKHANGGTLHDSNGSLSDRVAERQRALLRLSEGAPPIRRDEVYPRRIVDGRELRDNPLARLRDAVGELLRSAGERDELALSGELAGLPDVSRSNTVAVISPKGGVGKTTSAFLIGDALAEYLKLRAVAVDTNPDFGTLADLAPERSRVERSLAELIEDLDRIDSSAALRPYMSQLPSGLHLLGAPANAELMADMTPEVYGRLLDFLGRFYELVLLDCGTGITDPLAQFAIKRADQTVVVTTPDWVTASQVLGALHHLSLERGTLVLNRAQKGRPSGQQAIAAQFAQQRIAKRVMIPDDDRLRTMLDSGTYSLERLDRRVRLAIKRLALAVGAQLV
jgi:MinD-like ATPase involved in chromosome partitioning or flagellar assembly